MPFHSGQSIQMLSQLIFLLTTVQRILQKTLEEGEFSDRIKWQVLQDNPNGVRYTNSISHMLPSETALLADVDTESLFLAHFVSNRVRCTVMLSSRVNGWAQFLREIAE